MATVITAAEAERNFAEILERVRANGESFVIERSGQKVAELLPAPKAKTATLRDLALWLERTPLPDDTFAEDVMEGIRNQPPADMSDPWER